MFPNPQEALPLPRRPNLEQYKKQARDLVNACRSGDATAIGAWAKQWVRALDASASNGDTPRQAAALDADAAQVEEFARKTLLTREPAASCSLTGAQFVIARSHGFTSWPRFRNHVESLAQEHSAISAFEAAATAIVTGDVSALERLLTERRDLVHARSTREHRATLLHYVSANGVEGYRQKTPSNIDVIARMLLDRGAEVDAEADVYGGACTPLGLVATSEPPRIAGAQRALIDILLERGARMDRRGIAGHRQSLVSACLANGQSVAAAYLVSRGAPFDLPAAAGLGRTDDVARLLEATSGPELSRTLHEAFSMACAHGQPAAVDLLLTRGVDVDVELRGHGDGHTGLHVASFHGHTDVVRRLLLAHARVDVVDKTWGTTPLIWALTGWRRQSLRTSPGYYDVVAQLVRAGSVVTGELEEWITSQGDARMAAALSGQSQPDTMDTKDAKAHEGST